MFTIAVPTTAGTAAEVTINYVITDVEKKRKFVCVDTHDIPEVAVVDPDMMASMPKGLTAATGMDALTHAIEGYITKGAWEMTDMFHLKAIELISRSTCAARWRTRPRDARAWRWASTSPAWASPTWAWASCTAWRTAWAPCTTRRTAWPTPSCCRRCMEYNKHASRASSYRAHGRGHGRAWTSPNMNDAEAADAAIAAVRQLSADVGIPAEPARTSSRRRTSTSSPRAAYADACRPGNPRDTSVEEIVDLYRSQL